MKSLRSHFLVIFFPLIAFLPMVLNPLQTSVVMREGFFPVLFTIIALFYCPVILPFYFASRLKNDKQLFLCDLHLQSGVVAIVIYFLPLILLQVRCLLTESCGMASFAMSRVFLLLLVYNIFMTYLLSLIVGFLRFFRHSSRVAPRSSRKKK